MISFDFGSASQLSLRAKVVKEIPQFARSLGGSRALIVTGAGPELSNLADLIAADLAAVDMAGVILSRVRGLVDEGLLAEGTRVGRGANVDLVIGVGGGNSLAAAKLIACLLEDRSGHEAICEIAGHLGKRLPLILVPTTSGSGSEVTPVATFNTASGDIRRVIGRKLLPDVALLDPETTLDLPWHVTSATAVEAVGRAVEAYHHSKTNLLTNMVAARALKLLASGLPKILHEPRNLSIRTDLMAGSMLAGMAAVNYSASFLEALSLPLANRWLLPPSLSTALMLIPFLKFAVSSASEHYEQLGRILDLKSHTAYGFVDEMKGLMVESNLPIRLKDMGVSRDSFDTMVDVAHGLANDSMFRLTKSEIKQLYEAAYSGW